MEESTQDSMGRSMEFGRRGSILKRRDVDKMGYGVQRYLNDPTMVLLPLSSSSDIADKSARSNSSLSLGILPLCVCSSGDFCCKIQITVRLLTASLVTRSHPYVMSQSSRPRCLHYPRRRLPLFDFGSKKKSTRQKEQKHTTAGIR